MEPAGRVLPGDWYPGTIPQNVLIHESAYTSSSYAFTRCYSNRRIGVQIGRGASLCEAAVFDVGPQGVVTLGEFSLVNAARIICDAAVEIGDYTLVSWHAVLMDSYRVPLDPLQRALMLQGDDARVIPPKPIRIGRACWIGFEACVLPGVTIGEGSIVGARAVVTSDVPPFAVVAGNPARVIRRLSAPER